ncbi:MAG: biotin--[Clostridia bacterium]|nr:biotin--[acetyl-CoA-carboxylase] ligase [Clostridia bacterium]
MNECEYCLQTETMLREQLGIDAAQWQLRVFEEIDSTNTEAKRMAADGFDGSALIVADRQTAGRGRMGRRFYSPKRTGAYFSVLYTPSAPLSNAVRITGAAAVAAMRAIRSLMGKQVGIKWVNDLYFNDKKIAGILAESVVSAEGTRVIVGIGINLCTADFPAEIASVAGSLNACALSPAQLIAATVRELMPYLDDPQNRSWLDDYRRCSTVLGKPIYWLYEGRRYDGVATEIDDDGALIAMCKDGVQKRLSTGEITVRLQ